MSWGSNSSNGRKPTHKRGPVVWTDKSGGKPAPFAQDLPTYSDGVPPAEDVVDNLVIGAMFSANLPLNPARDGAGKFPHLIPHYWPENSALIKQKTLLIYTGMERIDERERNGRIISVQRHTFFAIDGRYIVTDFTYIAPVVPG